ncbi:DUF1127 domain-containing protein [Rhizobium halophytocola]|uniref:Uncharacterized protein YjiS (DUF1127 family) n=1 Tax=Rhizobium halophytocola TaxID=735519 RepID=A0ABS4DXT5_9HYPH|nr:DUF1127 domain-containing protein [Rhizobium halophytocola]MBP1850503.1 uncharacterized protein YjiS (DUF1127 family) [Rhizobium halophytocola]
MSTVAFSPATAAQPVALSTNVVVAVLTRVAGRWQMIVNRRAAQRLCDLDDHALADIGLTRSDLDSVFARAGLIGDPTVDLARLARHRSVASL